jgi:hypothetical protein
MRSTVTLNEAEIRTAVDHWLRGTHRLRVKDGATVTMNVTDPDRPCESRAVSFAVEVEATSDDQR